MQMPRGPREKSKTGIYHIMMRGIDKRGIFLCESDNYAFLHHVEHAREKSNFSLFAYCLMVNHVHLLIKEGNEEIGDSIRRINVGYAQYHNNKHTRVGHLFQNRFLSEPVDNDAYLLAVVRYIHQNPLKAKIVNRMSDYQWSSYRNYLTRRSTLVDFEDVMGYFGSVNEFINFHTQEGNEQCLEYIEKTRFSDDDLYQTVKDIVEPEKLKKMENVERNELIKKIKEETGASSRQLERVLGIGRSIILKT